MSALRLEQFIGSRTEVLEGPVNTTPVVKRRGVAEEVGPCLAPSAVGAVVYPLALQDTEEAFHRSVIVPVTDPTSHTCQRRSDNYNSPGAASWADVEC